MMRTDAYLLADCVLRVITCLYLFLERTVLEKVVMSVCYWLIKGLSEF